MRSCAGDDAQPPTHLIVDERPVVAAKLEPTAPKSVRDRRRAWRALRSVRKNNAELIVATQEVEKLMSNELEVADAAFGRVRVLLGQSEDTAAAAVGAAYKLSADEIAGIRYAKQGDMLLMIDNLRVPLKVWLDPKRLALYSMNAEEQSRIAGRWDTVRRRCVDETHSTCFCRFSVCLCLHRLLLAGGVECDDSSDRFAAGD